MAPNAFLLLCGKERESESERVRQKQQRNVDEKSTGSPQILSLPHSHPFVERQHSRTIFQFPLFTYSLERPQLEQCSG